MSVYSINGDYLTSVYDILANLVCIVYDINAVVVFDDWYSEIITDKKYDLDANTYYYTIRIPQTRATGQKQYPFLYVPNGSGGGTMSTLQMMLRSDFYFGINAGYFDMAQHSTYRPYGITIENGILVREDSSYFMDNYTLVIDGNGDLDYANPMSSGVTGNDVLNMGAVSSALGLIPLVVDGHPFTGESQWWTRTDRAQRQIIGQYANGDYCIITSEGRGFDSSDGFTVSEARDLCLSMGLQYAHMMDGGGSAETVLGKKQINTIYEGTYGRIVPTYIVFNGTDTFGAPQ